MIVQGPLFISYSYKHLLANDKLLAIVSNYSVLVTADADADFVAASFLLKT